MSKTEFRFAKKEDTALILNFIKELAKYENLSSEVVADATLIKEKRVKYKGRKSNNIRLTN
jgi:hypothetical protein